MKIIAPEIKNMPWQEPEKKPENAPVWRYRENPVVGRNPVKGVSRIFNSAVVPWEDGLVGVFRGEPKTDFTGILSRKKSVLQMKTDRNLCLDMPMTQGL